MKKSIDEIQEFELGESVICNIDNGYRMLKQYAIGEIVLVKDYSGFYGFERLDSVPFNGERFMYFVRIKEGSYTFWQKHLRHLNPKIEEEMKNKRILLVEQRELARLEHLLEDPYGEENWI